MSEQTQSIDSILIRLNELRSKISLDQSEFDEITMLSHGIISTLSTMAGSGAPAARAFMQGLHAWNETQRYQKIEAAVRGFATLFEKNSITHEQLDAAIELNETTVKYLERRMGGSNIFTTGLAMELKSLQQTKKTSESTSEASVDSIDLVDRPVYFENETLTKHP